MRQGFARRFVAGETLAESMRSVSELARTGRRVVLNHLGENVATANDARGARDSYLEMLEAIRGAEIDGNISIKLTQLGLDFDRQLCLSLAIEIAAAAKRLGRTIEVDMEGSAYTAATLDIFEALQRQCGNAGLAIQAYLRRSESDIERLAHLRPKIRLVKGAYLEAASLAFQTKREVDGNYRKLLDRLLRPDGASGFVTAIATHDPALQRHAIETIRRNAISKDRYEFQMLLGIRRDLQDALFSEGHPLRIYIPFGTAWCPYFMRRLAERPANLWFVVRSLLAE
jgi:proline dehydrogenase